jgi:hypothetical protein
MGRYKYFVEVIGLQYYVISIIIEVDNDDTKNANRQ